MVAASDSGKVAELWLPSTWKVVGMISFAMCWDWEGKRRGERSS
jgi:hypothetical protein